MAALAPALLRRTDDESRAGPPSALVHELDRITRSSLVYVGWTRYDSSE